MMYRWHKLRDLTPGGAADAPPTPGKVPEGLCKGARGNTPPGGASASPGPGLASVGLHHGVD